jgi:hypothetical protein
MRNPINLGDINKDRRVTKIRGENAELNIPGTVHKDQPPIAEKPLLNQRTAGLGGV